MKIAFWDIETHDLNGAFGPLLCASILSEPEGVMKSFRQDEYVRKGLAEDMLDDRQLCVDLRDYLETFHITCGWFCLEASHKVLTAELRWVEAGSLKAGDAIISFDDKAEHQAGRRWNIAYVESNHTAEAPCYEVTLSNGQKLIATAEHPWLAYKRVGQQYKWVRTRDLQPGKSALKQILPTWEANESYDAGWLAGMLDGEGNLAQYAGLQVAITQKDGEEVKKLTSVLSDLGFDFTVRAYDKEAPHMRQVLLRGGKPEALRLLGTARAERLIRKLDMNNAGTIGCHDRPIYGVVSVEPIGMRQIALLSTSSGTYIGEGFGCHNSKGFDITMLNTRLAKWGERPLKPMLHLDGIWYFKGWRGLKAKSAKLADVSDFFGFEPKPEVDPETWLMARHGKKKAMDVAVQRCEADVRITKQCIDKALDLELVRNIQRYP